MLATVACRYTRSRARTAFGKITRKTETGYSHRGGSNESQDPVEVEYGFRRGLVRLRLRRPGPGYDQAGRNELLQGLCRLPGALQEGLGTGGGGGQRRGRRSGQEAGDRQPRR